MVLAAGLGTRLRPLTDVCAKPLVPVGDRPALAHVLEKLRESGFARVVVNAHHRADQVSAFVRAQRGGVAVSEERELLGTAGGVARAGAILGEGDVLVHNADIFADVDFCELLQAHAGGNARDATLVVQLRARGDGNVGLDAEGRVVRLRGDGVDEEARGADFLGVHVLGSALRARLPERGCLVSDLYIPAMRAGAVLRAFPYAGPWSDIGSQAGYMEANWAWLKARGLSNWLGPGANVAHGVLLDCAVVGAGALVRGKGRLARCVVWPESRAKAPRSDAVFIP